MSVANASLKVGAAGFETVTSKDFDDEFPTASFAVQVTVVTPKGNMPPFTSPVEHVIGRGRGAVGSPAVEVGVGAVEREDVPEGQERLAGGLTDPVLRHPSG